MGLLAVLYLDCVNLKTQMNRKLNIKGTFQEVLLFVIITLPIAGIVVTVTSVEKWWNYNELWKFVFVCAGISVVLGVIISVVINRTNPSVLSEVKHKNNLWLVLVPLFFGVFAHLLSNLNNSNEQNDLVQGYVVVEKIYKPYRYGRAEKNILIIEIDDTSRKVNCRQEYWAKVPVGEKIPISVQTGKLGFEYINLVDHYW